MHGFRSSSSTADLLTVASGRIARAFNRPGATRALALDISNAFDKVWHAGLLHKLKSFRISSQTFGIIYSFLSNRGFEWFWMGSLHKNIQLVLEFVKAPFLVIHFLLYINDLPGNVICDIAINADDTILYSKCDQAPGLWQHFELAPELKSDL